MIPFNNNRETNLVCANRFPPFHKSSAHESIFHYILLLILKQSSMMVCQASWLQETGLLDREDTVLLKKLSGWHHRCRWSLRRWLPTRLHPGNPFGNLWTNWIHLRRPGDHPTRSALTGVASGISSEASELIEGLFHPFNRFHSCCYPSSVRITSSGWPVNPLWGLIAV